ncbi:Hypothetical predicted protein [Paramuricea clavata]|uniref:Uncharacterized protein n=1 Tax=Paramuricea clavata TaxID=317549 RepID=A0A6S7GKH9_PARCT|nr:Hypothetical predicted protein [Paramuricea clavata]
MIEETESLGYCPPLFLYEKIKWMENQYLDATMNDESFFRLESLKKLMTQPLAV